jgi:arylsulfatase A-like enzyme
VSAARRTAGALLLAGLAAGCADRQASSPAAAPRPNVLVYLIDTLRADRLGCYGNPRGLTPAIDAFAGQAVLFENAVAHAPWTRPSVASVFTSLTPLEHGVRRRTDRLADEAETLPEILRAAGWSTAAFSTNAHVSAATGFDQGFDHFDLSLKDTHSETLTRRVLDWLDGRGKAADPWFIYAHALDPHPPYVPVDDLRRRFAAGITRPGAGTHPDIIATLRMRPAERVERVRELRDLYDAEVADTDRAFGALLDGLRGRGNFENTVIVVLADHGEGFDEHGLLTHSNSLFAELIDIPMIVKPPGKTPARRETALARQIDVLPTVLAAAGVPPSAAAHGRDLLAAGPPPAPPIAVLDLAYERIKGSGLVIGEWKYIAGRSKQFGRRPMLFSRRTDRGEVADLGEREPARRAAMAEILARELGRRGQRPARATLDTEGEAALRALGYL